MLISSLSYKNASSVHVYDAYLFYMFCMLHKNAHTGTCTKHMHTSVQDISKELHKQVLMEKPIFKYVKIYYSSMSNAWTFRL